MNTISRRKPPETEFRNRRTTGQFRLSGSHPRLKARLITSGRNQAKGKKKREDRKSDLCAICGEVLHTAHQPVNKIYHESDKCSQQQQKL